MRTRRWVQPVLVSLFAFGSVTSIWAETKSTEKPVAVVNGEAIKRADFDNLLRRVPNYPGKLSDADKKLVQQRILDGLIDEALFRQFLKKSVPPPDAALVGQRIKALETSLKAQGRSLQDYYLDTGHTEEQLRAEIAASIQWNAYTKKNISEADLKRCYEQNRELFDGVMVRVSHIALRASQKDARSQQAVVLRLGAIREEILKGMDFAAAAKKYSEDPSAANGGDLGLLVPIESKTDPFFKAVMALKVGQVSEIVQTEFGYHLIKVTERVAGKPTNFEEIKDEVRVLCADDLAVGIVAEQRKTAKLEVNGP